MKNIIFWGGYTTHMFELIVSMIKLGYNVKVIRYTNCANEKGQSAYHNIQTIIWRIL